jgi:SAM-dependent methyltransferase
MTSQCPICRGELGPAYFQMHGVPTLDGAVCDTLEEADRCPTGDVTIRLCETCGWIGNASFDPARLSYEKYHFSLHHSPAFDAFIDKLIDRLTDRFGLTDGKVLDVGCGSGDLLRDFADRVRITGLGIDPSIDAATEQRERGVVSFERGLLEPRHAGFDADLLCCRHVLNSMPDPLGLLRQIRAVARGDAAFYLEVPHADQTFGHDIGWNVAYEHHSWFNEASFSVLCRRAGFEVLDVGPCWGDEYLGIELRLAEPDPDARAPQAAVTAVKQRLERFAQSVDAQIEHWSGRLARLRDDQKRVAIWGAGARALLFINAIPEAEHIGMLVDINPTRQDMYLAHVGHRIDPPDRLKAFDPDLLLISNSAFADEIRQQAAALGVTAPSEVF